MSTNAFEILSSRLSRSTTVLVEIFPSCAILLSSRRDILVHRVDLEVALPALAALPSQEGPKRGLLHLLQSSHDPGYLARCS